MAQDISGKCMCGAVTYRAQLIEPELGACHCSMCRRWTGGVFLALSVLPDAMTFEGEAHIQLFQSSPWAERGFCKNCGSSLFYRVTAAGKEQGIYHIGAGTMNDLDGITLSQQLFIDQKPDGYSFCETTADLTQEQVEAMFANLGTA
ncbi:GFA family protein [uncultured Litoreibacter sp.]|uniref:GFA family protein n=1 Tax=uncultured Litoreibacter sp. TaxID=1392394 RepID=UPI00260BA865|nr:GFA family protein [uncultured Litoreibacter sp.]